MEPWRRNSMKLCDTGNFWDEWSHTRGRMATRLFGSYGGGGGGEPNWREASKKRSRLRYVGNTKKPKCVPEPIDTQRPGGVGASGETKSSKPGDP